MAIDFPTSLDSLTNPNATDKVTSPSHADQHSNANDAIEALEAKVGINGSAVTTSHDYKLGGVTGSDKAASLAGSETLTNKTIDGDDNTVQDLALTSLKTVLADASKFVVRDGSGVVISNTKDVPSGVVVGTTDTQTLTNKKLSDSTTSIVDNADATKAVQFEVSGVSTATTRTITVLNEDVTMVGLTNSQTLTNKTIDGDDNTLQDIGTSSLKTRTGVDAAVVTGTAGTSGDLVLWNADGDVVDGPTPPSGTIVGTTDTQTLTNKTLGSGTAVDLGSDAQGDILYRNSSGNLARLGIGSTDQVLTVASGLPSWQDAQGGGSSGQSVILTGLQGDSNQDLGTLYGYAMLVNNGKRLLAQKFNFASSWIYWDRPTTAAPFSRAQTTVGSLTITPAVNCAYMDSGTEYVLGAALAGTAIYRYDNAGGNEASVTVSGTTLVGVRRMGYDGTNVYIQDDATNAAGTAVKKFTISGTTLTYVSTITLGTAPTGTSSTTSTRILLTTTYLLFVDVVTASAQTINVYNKSTGTLVTALPFAFDVSFGLISDWSDYTRGWMGMASLGTLTNANINISPFTYE